MRHNLQGSPDQGRRRLEELASAVNRKWKTHMALPLHLAAKARVLRLPFGIFELDWRTKGGAPINRLIRIWGKPSSLKSTTMLKIVRNAQNFCRHCKMPIVVNPKTNVKDCSCPNPRWTLDDPQQFEVLSDADALLLPLGYLPAAAKVEKKGLARLRVKNRNGSTDEILFKQTDRCEPFRCLYIDTEGTIDADWAEANGVDTKLLMVIGANWAEQVLNLTEEMIETSEFDIVIIDSLDMLTPSDTLIKALGKKKKVAAKASLLTDAVQKWTSAINAGGLLNRYTPTIFLVCQVRSHGIGKPWASLRPSGGWAIEHGASMDIKFEPKKYKYKGDRALYGEFEFTLAKSKVGGFPRSKGMFRYWLRSGGGRSIGDTEDMETVITHAGPAKIIMKSGSKWVLLSKFLPDGKVVCNTKKALVTFLRENPTIYQDLRYAVISYLIGEDVTITLPSAKIKKEDEHERFKKKLAQLKEMKKSKVKLLETIEA